MEWCKLQYCKDLDNLAFQIGSYDNDGVLSSVVASLLKASKNIQFNDGTVELENVECIIKKCVSKTNPANIQELTVFLDYCCSFDLEKDINEFDRVGDDYSFQLEIQGTSSENKTYTCAWHLDKNEDCAGEHKFTHPLYHFQFGGHRMANINLGQSLLLGSPRLPHPPMDIVLSIHFIIKNFLGRRDYSRLYEMLEDEAYIEILERAQSRMFKPYFNAFKDNNNHQDFTLGNVFPLAI